MNMKLMRRFVVLTILFFCFSWVTLNDIGNQVVNAAPCCSSCAGGGDSSNAHQVCVNKCGSDQTTCYTNCMRAAQICYTSCIDCGGGGGGCGICDYSYQCVTNVCGTDGYCTCP